MPPRQSQPIVFGGLRGRDGSTTSVGLPPEFGGIPMNKCREAVNVTFDRCGFARKRGGASSFGLGFDSGGPFASGIQALGVAKDSNGQERIWAVDGSQQIAYTDDGIFQNGWVEPSIADTPTGLPFEYQFVMFDGMVYITATTAFDRLQVWDGTSIRRAGQGSCDAPGVSNTGAGAYAATLRYYRGRFAVLSGSNVVRMGEAGPSTSFTPSGGGTAARVARPNAVDADPTHWRVEVSLDNSVWYVLSSWLTVATGTYDDSAATTTYSSGDLAPLAGDHTPWTDVEFLVAAEGRLIGATKSGRVYYSAIVGETSESFLDQERVPNTVTRKNYFDIEDEIAYGSRICTGLAWWEESLWVFQANAVHRYSRTGLPESPFRRARTYRGKAIGTKAHRSIVKAFDEIGQPALYWWSESGPRRMTLGGGLQYMGTDLEDVLDTLTIGGAIDPIEHAVYIPEQHAIWFWTTTNGTDCNTLCVFDTRLGNFRNGVVRDGWSTFTGTIASAACSVLASDILDGAANSAVPWVGLESGTTLLQYDPAATSDNGTQFQAYVDIPERPYGGVSSRCQLTGAEVVAHGSGTTALRLTISRDNAAVSRSCDVTIADGETRGKFKDAEMIDADTLKFRIGDSAASTETWAIDALVVAIEGREARFP